MVFFCDLILADSGRANKANIGYLYTHTHTQLNTVVEIIDTAAAVASLVLPVWFSYSSNCKSRGS